MRIAQPIDIDVCPFRATSAMTVDCCDVGQGQTKLTIDTLPDDVLLYVFDFYVAQASEVEDWHTLVHVCRRWRHLVFESPRRLNLRIECTAETPVREKLDIWPPLPIVIFFDQKTVPDNIKAALEHHDRVCRIELYFVACNPEDIIPSLEVPFPMLTDLVLSALFSFRPFEPDPSKFLGGGSAHLRSLSFTGSLWIPDLLKLFLSTPNLVIFVLMEFVPVLFYPTR